MGDSWLQEFDSCAGLAQDVMEKIHTRNCSAKGTSTHSKISAEVRSKMRQYSSNAANLRSQLASQSANHRITQREKERRQVQVDQLVVKEKQMEASFKNEKSGTDFGSNRTSLFEEGLGESRGNGFGQRDMDNMANLEYHEVKQQQQQVIREQDAGLDALSHVLGRQKQMALDIGNEVDYQNDLIDDITDHTDRTDQRLLRETRHIKIVDRKSNTCGFLVTIVLLFIAIIVILVVPYHKSSS